MIGTLMTTTCDILTYDMAFPGITLKVNSIVEVRY